MLPKGNSRNTLEATRSKKPRNAERVPYRKVMYQAKQSNEPCPYSRAPDDVYQIIKEHLLSRHLVLQKRLGTFARIIPPPETS